MTSQEQPPVVISRMSSESKDEAERLKAEEARSRAEVFLEKYGNTISAYFGNEAVHFTCQAGGWYIDMETGRTNMDPNFFLEKGYGDSEALFAMFHEAEHFRDAARDPEAYRAIYKETKQIGDKVHPAYRKALDSFLNCLDDVMVNNTVMGRWKAGYKAKNVLYKEKLFPTTDYRDRPKHQQLMYAFLREAMVPDEQCLVDEEVRRIIDEYNGRTQVTTGQTTIQVISAFNPAKQAPNMPTSERYEHILMTLEPACRRLFLEDVRNWEESKDEKGEGKPAPNPFEGDPFEESIFDPISRDEIIDQIDSYNRKKKDKEDHEFKDIMGVERKDFDAYRQDYKVIEPYLREMNELFDRLIQDRINYRRSLTKPATEGPVLDRSKLAIGMAAMKAGNLAPEIFLEYESKRVVERQPSEIEFHVVVDGTGSVETDKLKIAAQRQAVILFLESIHEFRHKLNKARQSGVKFPLSLKTEVRQFADTDKIVLPMTESLDLKQRVAVRKEITDHLLGGDNNERETFDNLLKDLTEEKQRKIKSGDLRVITIVLTDGGTEVNMQEYMRKLQAKAGSKTGYAIGAIGYGRDGKVVEQVYRPVGKYAPEVRQLPKALEEMLIKMLER